MKTEGIRGFNYSGDINLTTEKVAKSQSAYL